MAAIINPGTQPPAGWVWNPSVPDYAYALAIDTAAVGSDLVFNTPCRALLIVQPGGMTVGIDLQGAPVELGTFAAGADFVLPIRLSGLKRTSAQWTNTTGWIVVLW